jgi:hypothetical protein
MQLKELKRSSKQDIERKDNQISLLKIKLDQMSKDNEALITDIEILQKANKKDANKDGKKL